MAKARRGTALFEVFESKQPARTVATPPDESPRNGDRTSPRIGRAAPPLEPSPPSRAAQKNSGSEKDTTGRAVPFVQLDGDRLTLTFSTKGAAITMFVALTLVGAAYILGDRFGTTGFRRGYDTGRASLAEAPADELDAIRQQPPATHVIQSLLVNSAGAGQPARQSSTEAPAQWIDGYTYVVVQEFGSGATEEVDQAATYLAEKGVATERVALPNGGRQLVASQGFNMKEPAQKQAAEQFLDKIHRLGADYYASGGRYRLKGYFKTVRGEDW